MCFCRRHSVFRRERVQSLPGSLHPRKLQEHHRKLQVPLQQRLCSDGGGEELHRCVRASGGERNQDNSSKVAKSQRYGNHFRNSSSFFFLTKSCETGFLFIFFKLFLVSPFRHRRVSNLAGPVRPRHLRQHAGQLRVRVLRGIRERLHDDEELHGCVRTAKENAGPVPAEPAIFPPSLTAMPLFSRPEQTSTSARGTPCCAAAAAA